MAIDVLSIPCSSASVERLWSSAKLVVTDRRNRLEVETMEMLECLKSWRKIASFDMIGQFKSEEEIAEESRSIGVNTSFGSSFGN